MLARVGMDYGVVSDLHNMHFGVCAETFTSQPHRAPAVGGGGAWRGWRSVGSLDIQGFLWPTTMAHILGPEPTWPCLINGFERGH